MDNICRASNSVDVQIEDEEEPYEAAWALDSDDDRLVQEMTEQEIELIRRLCPERDPAVHEFSSLNFVHKLNFRINMCDLYLTNENSFDC